MTIRCDAVVVGAGIAGLTAAALLARAGLTVTLLEAHGRSGGCAGTFRRGPWVFDVGATQVAGLEPGGIHARLFAHLGVDPPAATPLDPGCVVDLADGRPPVAIRRDPELWRQERRRQFPGSERFWGLCETLHRANWAFAARDPVLPPRSLWDLRQLLGALGPATLASGLFAAATVADLLRLTGCGGDPRLRRFLDLQLRLYSQESADRTAALYGATVLAMVQEPLGLWHLQGSMQALSDGLEEAIARHGGQLRTGHRVERLLPPGRPGGAWRVLGRRIRGVPIWSLPGPGGGEGDFGGARDRPESREGGQGDHGDAAPGPEAGRGEPFELEAPDVVVTLPPQALPPLLGGAMPAGYGRRLQQLPEPSGALVFYGAVSREHLPAACPSHLQRDQPRPGPLFVSVSQEGDGRAPAGQATVIASVFTPARPWFEPDPARYRTRKQEALGAVREGLEHLLGLGRGAWLHGELATPRGFAGWTGRPYGYVGGLGQHPSRFGPFGLASRSPLRGLWLCGDSIHPGEGTAGVSLSALMACRQLLESRGMEGAGPPPCPG